MFDWGACIGGLLAEVIRAVPRDKCLSSGEERVWISRGRALLAEGSSIACAKVSLRISSIYHAEKCGVWFGGPLWQNLLEVDWLRSLVLFHETSVYHREKREFGQVRTSGASRELEIACTTVSFEISNLPQPTNRLSSRSEVNSPTTTTR